MIYGLRPYLKTAVLQGARQEDRRVAEEAGVDPGRAGEAPVPAGQEGDRLILGNRATARADGHVGANRLGARRG